MCIKVHCTVICVMFSLVFKSSVPFSYPQVVGPYPMPRHHAKVTPISGHKLGSYLSKVRPCTRSPTIIVTRDSSTCQVHKDCARGTFGRFPVDRPSSPRCCLVGIAVAHYKCSICGCANFSWRLQASTYQGRCYSMDGVHGEGGRKQCCFRRSTTLLHCEEEGVKINGSGIHAIIREFSRITCEEPRVFRICIGKLSKDAGLYLLRQGLATAAFAVARAVTSFCVSRDQPDRSMDHLLCEEQIAPSPQSPSVMDLGRTKSREEHSDSEAITICPELFYADYDEWLNSIP